MQEEGTEPLWEEQPPPQIVKIDKDENKVFEGKGRGRIRRAHRERKRKIGPKPGLPKNYSNEGTQIKNHGPLRCKNAKCHNECYTYKKECLELYNKPLHHR